MANIDEEHSRELPRVRARALRVIFIVLACLVSVKMFYLQAVRSDFYRVKADDQHQGVITLTARRGDIKIMNSSGEPTVMATDIALDLVFIDPAFIQNQTELSIERADTAAEKEVARTNQINDQEFTADTLAGLFVELEPLGFGEQLYRNIPELSPEDAENKDIFNQRILTLMETKEVNHVSLMYEDEITEEVSRQIEDLNLRGLFVTETEIYADPTLIEDIGVVSELVGPIIDMPIVKLRESLRRRPIRYVVLKRKVPPEVSSKITKLLEQGHLKGVGLIPEHWRFYPEDDLAANVIGFVNREGQGQYGVEEAFDEPNRDISLSGMDGWIQINRDPRGRQIAVGDSVSNPAVDGDDIVLTLDRIVQEKMQQIISDTVEATKAEKGSIVVMEPETGRILAMASYPTFNPNKYEDAMEKYEEGIDAGTYINKIGPMAYINIPVDIPYEPGSVFKVITMAAGLDTGEVTPNTVTYDRTGFIEVDNYIVRNSTLTAEGRMTMTNVLEKSSNLGAAFVSQKLGRSLFHKYIVDFGYGQPTDLQFINENTGWVKEPNTWANIDLVAASFGQGVSATQMQVTTSVSAIANGGKLMKPYIISEVSHSAEGTKPIFIERTEPQVVRQVISPDTSAKLTGMMVSVIDNGVAPEAKVKGYYVAGKTGTSQIARQDGLGYEKGPGSTVASLCGFAPADKPIVTVCIRVDRPLSNQWGSKVAAPPFSRAVGWLMQYYAVPTQR